MDEPEGQRVKHSADESALLAEPINPEDSHYAELRADLESDSRGLEAESWSSAVDQNYLTSLNKEAVKRQDVIYELIQTEMNHVRTLKILLHIYLYELKQFHPFVWLEKLFPGLEVLLSLHHFFLNSLKARQAESRDEDNPNNYYIRELADVLINQFSDNLGVQMTAGYGYFCSHHSEAVSYYKKQMQNNKKLQILIRKIDHLPLVRRLTIPECFLLVTQRITKYPVLLERIIQNTDADTHEHRQLEKALELIKHTISQVNSQVREYGKTARLREIIHRLEQKTQVKLKDGHWFRREDLMQGNKTLLHEGPLIWKSSGKQKEIYAVLLSDMLLLLQDKDQKLVLAAMDSKPPVIYLQGVIVREVAQEERGMYLICAWPPGSPEMYALYTSSKEECKTWTDLIRDMAESCRDNEVHREIITKLQQYQDKLQKRDEQIKKSLEKKQDIFAELYNDLVGQKTPHSGLLLRGDASDLQQGEALLSEAIKEVEKLQNLLFMTIRHPDVPETQHCVRRAQTFEGSLDNLEAKSMKFLSDEDAAEKAQRRHSSCDLLFKNMLISEDLEKSTDDDDDDDNDDDDDDESESHPKLLCGSAHGGFPGTAVVDSILSLAQKLYSLQAVIAQQDSRIELQVLFQSKSKLPVRSNTNSLLETEKERNLEKQKAELAELHKQQVHHQVEQQHWEKEREKQQVLIESQNAELQQREEECRKMEKELREKELELKHMRKRYQQDLERLRETTQKLDRDREAVNRDKGHLEKMKAKLVNHYDDPTWSPALSRSSTVNGAGTLTPVPNALVFTGNSPDLAETPPRVPPRSTSIRMIRQMLPTQLMSTTNQVQKPVEVQQKIPRKLAAEHKGKEKTKSKRSHERAHSAANIDVTQVIPIRVTGKNGGSLKSQISTSPKRVLSSDTFRPPGSTQNVKPSQSFIAPKWNNVSSLPPLPPPFPTDITDIHTTEQEKVILL